MNAGNGPSSRRCSVCEQSILVNLLPTRQGRGLARERSKHHTLCAVTGETINQVSARGLRLIKPGRASPPRNRGTKLPNRPRVIVLSTGQVHRLHAPDLISMLDGHWHFHCPECGMGDFELGHLADDQEFICQVCLEKVGVSSDGRAKSNDAPDYARFRPGLAA